MIKQVNFLKGIKNRILDKIKHITTTNKPLASLIMVGFNTFTTCCVMSTTPLNFASGAIFGVRLGSVIQITGCLIGASINHWISKYLAYDWINRKVSNSDRLKNISDAIKAEGLYMVIVSRLSPIFPFATISYILGSTNINFKDYLLGTAIGFSP